MPKLTLGFSPCPNDTFIFDALVNGRIGTGDLQFDVVMADVEQLNQMALEGKLDVTKFSFGVYPNVHARYQLLNAGSALGSNCGPLLIAKEPFAPTDQTTIAIPGEHTTANFLLSFAFPQVESRPTYLFSDIENAVLNNEVDAGVIIHENRFTYAQKGLVKILDLGEHWEQQTGHPIPLGGIAVHRRLRPDRRLRIDQLVRQSVQYAFDHPDASRDYVACHAQEMDPDVMRAHIDLYVNRFSVDLGEKGRAAVSNMFRIGQQDGMPHAEHAVFVPQDQCVVG